MVQWIKDPVLSLLQLGRCCGIGLIPGPGTCTEKEVQSRDVNNLSKVTQITRIQVQTAWLQIWHFMLSWKLFSKKSIQHGESWVEAQKADKYWSWSCKGPPEEGVNWQEASQLRKAWKIRKSRCSITKKMYKGQIWQRSPGTNREKPPNWTQVAQGLWFPFSPKEHIWEG